VISSYARRVDDLIQQGMITILELGWFYVPQFGLLSYARDDIMPHGTIRKYDHDLGRVCLLHLCEAVTYARRVDDLTQQGMITTPGTWVVLRPAILVIIPCT
jgi:hypothetical protein